MNDLYLIYMWYVMLAVFLYRIMHVRYACI